MTARYLFICSALLLLANAAYGARYQRTKDGQTLIWNNLRGVAQEATWSGGRDSDGYATGEGTLTWYRGELKIATDSSKPLKEGSVVVSSYTGKMVRGKFEGLVVKEESGTILHTTFVNGNKANYWSGEPITTATPKTKEQQRTESARATPGETAKEPAPSPTATPPPNEQQWTEPTLTKPVEEAAAEEPAPSPSPVEQPRKEVPHQEAVVETPTQAPTEAPTQDTHALELFRPPSSLRTTLAGAPSPDAFLSPSTSSPSAAPQPVDPAVKNRMIAEFKEQTQSVLKQVGDATGNFRETDRLDAVQNLPAPVSASVSSLADRARDFRLKLGYETAFQESRAETETVEALSLVDEAARNIVAKDTPAARIKLTRFLKRYREPVADNQKPLWRYLTSVQSICNRLEKEADTHLQRAQSLASAGQTGEATQEYQAAYRIYPNPVTAEKIRRPPSSQSEPRQP